jgi:hypothetical protein
MVVEECLLSKHKVLCLNSSISKKKKKSLRSYGVVWWYTSAVPALGRLRQKDHEFEVSLGYIVRPCLKTIAATIKIPETG